MVMKSSDANNFFMKIKNLIKRSMLAFLFIFAFCLMLIGKADNVIIEKSRAFVADILVPVFKIISIPAETLTEISSNIKDIANLRKENSRLRRENELLKELQVYAAKINNEKSQLATLLNFVPTPNASYVSAEVLADSSNSYAQSVIAMAGSDNKIKKGQIVVNGDGLVGRVAFVGDKTSRIILITDLSSRVPISVEPSGVKGILLGNNTPYPQIINLLGDVKVNVGDKVVTSSKAGVYPSGIPVGVVTSINDNEIKIRTFTNMSKLDMVRIVDYGLTGILPEQKCIVEKD